MENMQSYLDKWLTFSAPASAERRKRIKKAVGFVYDYIGMREPQFVFCSGPWEKALFPGLVHLMMFFGKDVCGKSAPQRVSGEQPIVREEWLKFWDTALGQIDWGKEAGQSGGLGEPLYDRIHRKLIHRLEASLDEELESQLGTRSFESLHSEFLQRLQVPLEAIRDEIDFDAQDQHNLFKSLTSRLPEPFAGRLQSKRGVSELHPHRLRASWLGPWHWWFAGHNDFARKHLGATFTERARKRLDVPLDLNEAAAYLFFENVAFVYLKPVKAFFDDRWRLHNPTHAAIEFIDDTRLFVWKGIEVDESWITDPKKIKMRDIENQGNVELRRVMIEIYGLQNYLLHSGAKKVHEDEYGILYRRELPNDEPLVVVCVHNSTPEPDGDRKKYFLRVPPNIRTARAAVAWTFGMKSGEYKPKKET
jgi:hypothetical protein